VRDQLATQEAEEGRRRGMDPYDYLTELAEQVAPGSDGLLFLPLLAGERAPYWNANARGVFFGLSLFHEKKHMIRAVLEGVVYRIHSVALALEELGGRTKEIRASGGFARSPFWRQIMADTLGTPVTVPDSIESSGLGAAQLGLLSLGEIRDFSSIHDWVRSTVRHEPNAANNAVYRELTSIYSSVYHQLKDQFDAISAFQRKHVGGV
jgi:gluconokinase